jgi:dehydrogenase/reductase SDR family protein 7B
MGATASRGGGGDGADFPPRPSESARRAYRGKTILITGASRGLGRSIAIALASSCDPSLLILSGRDEGALAGVGGECERAMIAAAGDGRRRANALSDDDDDDDQDDGGARRVEIVVCDLADGASVERLAAESLRLAAFRRRAGRSPGGRDGAVVDVLINNGGVSSRSSFLETRIDVDEMVMRVNFHSGAALAKGLVPAMIGSGNGGGRVIWISSVQGKRELLFAGCLVSLVFRR